LGRGALTVARTKSATGRRRPAASIARRNRSGSAVCRSPLVAMPGILPCAAAAIMKRGRQPRKGLPEDGATGNLGPRLRLKGGIVQASTRWRDRMAGEKTDKAKDLAEKALDKAVEGKDDEGRRLVEEARKLDPKAVESVAREVETERKQAEKHGNK
jgi:hypothetical protein